MKNKQTEKKLRPSIGLTRHLIGGVLGLAVISLFCARASAQNLFAVGVDNSINEFTPNGVRSIFASGLTSPYALAFDNGGNLFVGDAGMLLGSEPNGAIYKFTPAGARTTFALGVSAPTGLAFDSEGNLFVAEFYTGNIYRFTPNGVRTAFASGVNQPQGLAFDRAGNLFVGVSGGVDKFTPSGVQTAFASGLLTPFALAFDSGGNLFVADGGVSDAGAFDYPPPADPPDYGAGAAVYKFTPSGQQSTVASHVVPDGLAIDSADNLFVGESHREQQNLVGSILKITPTGVRTTFASRIVGAMAFQRNLAPNPAPHDFDFNSDGHSDYLLYNASTRQTAIWYLNNNNVRTGKANGPTLWPGWSLVGAADFNSDGKPDYLLYNPTTRKTAIWHLNNEVRIGHAFGPTPWPGWSLVAP